MKADSVPSHSVSSHGQSVLLVLPASVDVDVEPATRSDSDIVQVIAEPSELGFGVAIAVGAFECPTLTAVIV
ncbi:hypothetical protein [Rhodococcoides yunnanense]|uniref:hypothetical protein n=1 Tax=Rhodococcoides yunnanense TaxID=278209 RepID=UPI000934EE3B|nr:hypothetical protein [Rhodococcus yunnanensis]